MQARFAGEHIRPTSGPVPGALATSLTLGRRDDAQEREADAVAARAGAGPATAAPAGPGAGHDFANVRIHTDSRAVASAEAIGADAYTVGQHIVFAPGRYRPESAEGRGLLAHELAHTVQQAGRPEPVVRGKWRMESHKVDSGLEVQREEENAEVSTYGIPGSVYGRASAWQEQGIIRTEVGGVAQVARWTTLHYVFKNDGTDRDFLRLETKGQVTGNAKAEDLDHARASGVVWGGITERTHANPTPPAHKLFEPLEEGSISAATVTDLGTVEVDLPIGEGGSVHGSFKLHRVVQGAAAPFTQSTQPAYDVSPDVDEVDVVVGARMEADASIESSHAIVAWLDENRSDAFASVMLTPIPRPSPPARPEPGSDTPEPEYGASRKIRAQAICKCVGDDACGGGKIHKKYFEVEDCRDAKLAAEKICNNDPEMIEKCTRPKCYYRHGDYKCPA
jgi:hypothetical protein